MNDSGREIPSTPIEATGTRPTNIRWRILALLMVSAALFHFNRISMSAAGTEHIMQENSISKTEMGFVYSSYLFAYTLCMMPGGWVIDRFGPRAGLLVVGIGSCLLVPLTGITGLIPWGSGLGLLIALCVVRGLLGIFSAPFHPSAARSVSFWISPPTRTLANGMVTGAAVLGIAATPYACGFLMDSVRWQGAFVIAGVVTVLVTSLWSKYATDHPSLHPDVNQAERNLIRDGQVPAQPPIGPAEPPDSIHHASVSSRDVFDLLYNRSLVMLTLSYAAYSYCQYLFFYWVQSYFDDIVKVGKDDARLYATTTNLAMAAGMICGGWVADQMRSRLNPWLGRAITPICGLSASAVFLMLGIAFPEPDPRWVATCFALSMAALGACEASFWMSAIELGGRRGGLSGAFLNTVGNASGILAPTLTPLFSEYFGWRAGLALASVFCLIGALLWGWILPQQQGDDTGGESQKSP